VKKINPSPDPAQENKKDRKIVRMRIFLLLACALLGFLAVSQYKSLTMTREERFVEGKSSDELALDYMALYNKNIELKDRNNILAQDIGELEAARNNDEDLEAILLQEEQATRKMAGLLGVSGGGISVLIAPDKDAPVTSNMMIQFVNEVKAADASAISVNGQRVVAMTEIRDNENGFTVNGVAFTYDDPISITAIGDGIEMYTALQMIGGVLDKWGQSHIDVHVDIGDNLSIPALALWQQEEMNLLPYADVIMIPSNTP
jgi:uncharacterized protein YlxW (UPF0749 family)